MSAEAAHNTTVATNHELIDRLEDVIETQERQAARLDAMRTKAELTQEAIAGTDEDIEGLETSFARVQDVARGEPILDMLLEVMNRLEDVEDRVDDPKTLEWEEMSKAQRVSRIRQHLAERAESSPYGKASMDAGEIDSLFNGHPSTGYTYKLMDAVAQADGYDVDKPKNGNKRVTVDLDP